jgi:hypothetical protein
MNLKTAKKLRRKSEKLALLTHLSASEQGLILKHGPQTTRIIYKDLKKGKIL